LKLNTTERGDTSTGWPRTGGNCYIEGVPTRLALTVLLAGLVAGVPAASAPRAAVDRFGEQAAFGFLKRQVELGPRPAGSPASRKLAAILKASIPRGRYQPVPGGLRNVISTVRGRDPRRIVVVGAHYDTKDLPGFVGANDAASGTAVVRELARTIKPRTVRPTLVFIFFDGEESPRGSDNFERDGLRGSKVAARAFRHAEAMVLLDFVGDRDLSIPREANSNRRLWRLLRTAARRVGVARVFPAGTGPTVSDDHIPFLEAGVPAIDLIDFDFPCWHRRCDNLSAVSVRSLDAVGETMIEFLRDL
jgi:glutaminyl-peptide cyclotransferase